MKILIKLSTVIGVAWLLGFGAAQNVIVAYFFVIINSFQGKIRSTSICNLCSIRLSLFTFV